MSVRAFAPRERPVIAAGARLTLDTEESHYLVKVRRLRIGASFELLDGEGGAWHATLCSADAKRAEIEITQARAITPASAERIVLLGLPDTNAALEALTLASELGASELLFVRCERSQGRLPSPARIERVLRAAMRQCGRPTPLAVRATEYVDFATALTHRAELGGVFGHPGASSLPTIERGCGLCVLVGPEGGLTKPELEAARTAGFSPLNLGPWILRTPTAVTALLARLT